MYSPGGVPAAAGSGSGFGSQYYGNMRITPDRILRTVNPNDRLVSRLENNNGNTMDELGGAVNPDMMLQNPGRVNDSEHESDNSDHGMRSAQLGLILPRAIDQQMHDAPPLSELEQLFEPYPNQQHNSLATSFTPGSGMTDSSFADLEALFQEELEPLDFLLDWTTVGGDTTMSDDILRASVDTHDLLHADNSMGSIGFYVPTPGAEGTLSNLTPRSLPPPTFEEPMQAHQPQPPAHQQHHSHYHHHHQKSEQNQSSSVSSTEGGSRYSTGPESDDMVERTNLPASPSPSIAFSRAASPATEASRMCSTDWSEPRLSDGHISFPLMPPDVDELFNEEEDLAHVPPVGQGFRDQLEKALKITQSSYTWTPISDAVIPPLNVLNAFIQLYWEYFHPLLPFLHKPTFDPTADSTHWILVLAVASVGARYSRVEGAVACGIALQELLRRSIQLTVHKLARDAVVCFVLTAILQLEHDSCVVRKLWLVQTFTLDHFNMVYSGSKKHVEVGQTSRNAPVTVGRRKRCFKDTINVEELTADMTLEKKWRIWVMDEQRRRAGYAIWLLDCEYALHSDVQPLLNMVEMQSRLPSDEPLWDAPTASAWRNLFVPSRGKGIPLLSPYEPILSYPRTPTCTDLQRGSDLPLCW